MKRELRRRDWKIIGAVAGLCSVGMSEGVEPVETNSLGMGFVEVRGTPVLVAQWEVRVKDFRAFVEDSGFQWEPGLHFEQAGDHPVVGVSRSDAVVFCQWLTKKELESGALKPGQKYRLPTSYEWSRAAGLINVAPDSPALEREIEAESHFVWGVGWPPPANAGNFSALDIDGYEDAFDFTAPVGSFAASAEGVYDLAGNAWEWVQDPAATGQKKGVLRGGSFVYFRKPNLLAAYEYRVDPGVREGTFGFRLVLEDQARNEAFVRAQSERQSTASASVAESLLPPQITEGEGGSGLPEIPAGAAPEPGKPHRNSLGMSFVPVDGIAGALVGEHEVRVQEFDRFVRAADVEWTTRPRYQQAPEHAAAGMSWQQAAMFCQWLTKSERASGHISGAQGYRLLTDLEWSKLAGLGEEGGSTPAARDSGTGIEFPWGDEWPPPPDAGNFDATTISGYSENIPYTAPVGSFEKLENGLYDLAGNVAEWVEDAWQPGGPGRVARGGSWIDYERTSLLAAKRLRVADGAARGNIGFRVVLVTGGGE